MSKSEGDQRLEKAHIGYQTAMGLVGLVSQETYSRFAGMLTANSIIIAIIGWTLATERILPPVLTILLSIVGLILCFLWFLFNNHGVYYQNLFRKKAIELENSYFSDTFKLISLVVTENPKASDKKNSEIPKLVRWFPYHRTSLIVIIVFAIVYVAMLLYQIICNGV
ncbi:MAG: hypothetical protein QME40_06160 [bacterium]|nr:hypothetical protein [Methanobacteriaceae archaeon]MDI6704234.1 hypothetical protein [bacterium]